MILTLVAVVLYLPELSVFSLSIDEEVSAFRTDAAESWLGQGRWTIYLVETLFFRQPVMPFLPVFVFCVLGAAAYIWLLRAHQIQRPDYRTYLLFPIFIFFPSWFFILEFYANTPGIAVGLLTACYAIYCFSRLTGPDSSKIASRDKAIIFASAALCGAIAIGAYQSFLMLLGAMGVGVILTRLLAGGSARGASWRGLIVLGSICLFSLVLYYSVLRALMVAFDVRPSSYLDGFIQFHDFLTAPGKLIERSGLEFWLVYSGGVKVYGHLAWAFGLVVAGGIVYAVMNARRYGIAVAFAGAGLIFVVLAAPFALHPISGGVMPYRSLVAVPYAVWLCGFLMLGFRTRVLKVASLFLVGVVIFQSMYTLSLSAAANSLVRDHDRLLAKDIYDRIADANSGFDPARTYHVDTFGNVPFKSPYPRISSSTTGASFFEWDDGNPYRILSFMRLIGYTNVEPVDNSQRAQLIENFVTMPAWPDRGSVKVVDGATLVKLGNAASASQRELLGRVPFAVPQSEILYQLKYGAVPELRNAVLSSGEGAFVLKANPDPQLFIELDAVRLRGCRLLQIGISQIVERPDQAQVFYRPAGEQGFSGKYSSGSIPVSEQGLSSLFVSSEKGFETKLRIDLVEQAQTVSLSDIEVGCLQRR
jgi:hypothetical protein